MDVKTLKPVFKCDGHELDVPDHLQGNIDGLRNYHAILYPAVATAELIEVGAQGDTFVYEYRRMVGTKGAA